MQLKKHARTALVGAIVAGGAMTAGAGGLLATATPASADTLPAYTSGGFCTTQTVNYFHDIKKEICTGYYRVNRRTYKFTQDATHVCPRTGIMAELTERWISPPTGGDPTILAGYTVRLR